MVSDFLARMAGESHARVADAKRKETLGSLAQRAADTPPPPRLSIDRSGFQVIAEYKRRAPSTGALSADFHSSDSLADRVAAYALGGAAAISVLTEPNEFRGSLADLTVASKATSLPVMRKDFLVDPYQIYQTRVCGGAGILLIIRLLDDVLLRDMLSVAAETDQFVLLEAFDSGDATRASEAVEVCRELEITTLVGANARSLVTLQTHRERLGELCKHLPRHHPRVAESSLLSPEHAAEVAGVGYDMALVGTALMRDQHPAALVAAMIAAGRSARRQPCTSR